MRKLSLILVLSIFVSLCTYSTTIPEMKRMIEDQKYPEAFKAIEERLKIDPKNHFLHEYNGDIYFALTEYKKAIDSFRKSLLNSVKKKDIDRVLEKVQQCKEGLYQESLKNLIKSKGFQTIDISLPEVKVAANAETIEFDSEFGFKKFGRRVFGPVSFAVNSKSIYVLDNINFKVKEFDQNGKLKREFGKESRSAGGMYRPVDIGADENGNVYVLDMHSKNLRVIKYTDGEFVKEVKVLNARQLNRIRVYKDSVVVECVREKNRVYLEYDHDLKLKKERKSYFEDNQNEYRMENIFYNVFVINKQKLEKEYKIEYLKNTVSRDLLFADQNEFFVAARRIVAKKERGRDYLLDIHQIDKDGKILSSITFSPDVMGNMFRTRKYYLSPETGIMYVSSINENEFKLLKFKLF